MARAVDKIAKEIEKQTADQMAADIAAKENTYNLNVGAINDNYAVDVANTEEAYNKLYDTNAVSRIINERKIAENMANLGLTDSGLNRTQQTANQLSYANTNNQIGIQKQKAIDTLAQTMRNKITELDIKKNEDIAGIKSAYKQSAMQQATDIHNAEVKADADRYAADVSAAQNAQKRYGEMVDDYYADVFPMLKGTRYDDDGNIIPSAYTNEEKANMFERWINKYSDVADSATIDSYFYQLPIEVQNILRKKYGGVPTIGYFK
jgi:hypothetical protein